MSEILVTILLTVWVLGLLSSYTLGGAIHGLLIVALVLAAFRWNRRRRGI
ncbi:lmo0937 family membrane protein [Opitutaceae bacterium EW11]|nr:lmo0937 family membrane protein [Opitutaceae bacterium EW11]